MDIVHYLLIAMILLSDAEGSCQCLRGGCFKSGSECMFVYLDRYTGPQLAARINGGRIRKAIG